MILVLGMAGNLHQVGITLDQVDKVSKIAQAIAAVAAVAIGALWTYFRFVRDRTYRPRFEYRLTVTKSEVNGQSALHCRIAVRNISQTSWCLLQRGTGLRARGGNVVAGEDRPVWQDDMDVVVFPLLKFTETDTGFELEPGEEKADEVLVPMHGDYAVWLVQARFVWQDRPDNQEDWIEQIVPPFATYASASRGMDEGR